MTEKEKEPDVKLVSWFDEHWYKIFLKDENGEELTDYYPSTTTKLSIIDKPGLLRWYSSIGEREARKRTQEAADRGSRIHHAAQILLGGGAVIYNPLQHPTYDGEGLFKLKKKYHDLFIIEHQDEMLDVWKIKRFIDIVNPLIIAREIVLYTTKYKEAGTADLIIKVKEDGVFTGITKEPLKLEKGIWICDYKTGNLYDEARMQLASYGYMFKEMSPLAKDLRGALIIHTGSKSRTGIPGLDIIKINTDDMKINWQDYRHAAAMWERKNKNAMPRMLEFPSMLAMDSEEVKQ